MFTKIDWQQFVTNKLFAWEQMNLQWTRNFTGDVHIVYYDNLVDDVEATLRGILEFLRFPINEVGWTMAVGFLGPAKVDDWFGEG